MKKRAHLNSGIAPKKSLGQNFLNSVPALIRMVEAADLSFKDTVLEIGPGRGALTAEMLRAGAKIIAIEKDSRLIPILHEKFVKELQEGRLAILEEDILKINPENIPSLEKRYKLVANIPYYITGELLRKFLETRNQPETIVVLVQKEVAKRILAQNKKESILSLSIKAYGTPRIVQTVKAGSFFPKPKVDSAILAIDSVDTSFFKGFSEKEYFAILHTGFSQKRKLLKRNLEVLFSKERIEGAFVGANISPHSRAEDVSLEEWAVLCTKLGE